MSEQIFNDVLKCVRGYGSETIPDDNIVEGMEWAKERIKQLKAQLKESKAQAMSDFGQYSDAHDRVKELESKLHETANILKDTLVLVDETQASYANAMNMLLDLRHEYCESLAKSLVRMSVPCEGEDLQDSLGCWRVCNQIEDGGEVLEALAGICGWVEVKEDKFRILWPSKIVADVPNPVDGEEE